MTFEPLAATRLDYLHCRHGNSKLLFRGPKRRADGNHIAVLGGTETYGKFTETPWPEMLEQLAAGPTLNLAQMNAGLDVFLNDGAVQDICRHARVTVIEMSGAENLSNRYYAVHPRRNDRFLRASTLLRSAFPEIDFTEYNFTRHLLAGLRATSPERFADVVAELKTAWAARMKKLIGRIGGRVLLLWLSDHAPDAPVDDPLRHGNGLFIDAAMIDSLRPLVSGVVEIVADADERKRGMDLMVFDEMDAPAATEMLGPVVHKRAAREVAEALRAL
ncbi:DUF6473 family protein [Frigidibacter sp. ROC022]|uniref:DUF6473 family protein n=1 Tax=Frigidibacter sp. ROC022 TaxID=2971796 RepID=UPI00215B679F|nr:DUF6473 family protein [Frigidibacter sp. ROC022]MCR8726526.1 DUF6473 family protein [Frigidibacter sp. ROC022]